MPSSSTRSSNDTNNNNNKQRGTYRPGSPSHRSRPDSPASRRSATRGTGSVTYRYTPLPSPYHNLQGRQREKTHLTTPPYERRKRKMIISTAPDAILINHPTRNATGLLTSQSPSKQIPLFFPLTWVVCAWFVFRSFIRREKFRFCVDFSFVRDLTAIALVAPVGAVDKVVADTLRRQALSVRARVLLLGAARRIFLICKEGKEIKRSDYDYIVFDGRSWSRS